MKTLAAALVAVLSLVSSPASAQDAAELTASIKALQQQVDRLQALVAARTALPDPGLIAHLDAPIFQVAGPMRVIAFQGWGTECSTKKQVEFEVAVDGVVVPNTYIARMGRNDVVVASAGFCANIGVPGSAPWLSGGYGFVDVTNYAAGEHTIELRIRNAAGVTEKSNVWTITIQ